MRNWVPAYPKQDDFMPIVKCARCHKVFGRLECGYNLGDDWFHTECWHKMNDPERDKTMDDTKRFYAVRLGKAYVKHVRYLDGGTKDWRSAQFTLAANSIDAMMYDKEATAQELADRYGGEVCCFGIYNAKPIKEDLASVIERSTPSSGQGFGWALTQLRQGSAVTRSGWSGKGQWIRLQTPDQNSKISLPYIYFRTPRGDLIPWSPSNTDLVQTDWYDVKG